ncbi:MAG TPA: hypothetical protein VJ111_11100, partial [Chitinophagaceae bacterium]|nr:hypothetical protein [Chitinophagaceae bacterium]
LKIGKEEVKQTIFSYPEFISFSKKADAVFETWKKKNIPVLKNISIGAKPKKLIHELSEDLLQTFSKLHLVDKYDVYQHLMDYWSETMQDDAYVIAGEGWKTGAEVYRIVKQTKDKTGTVKKKEIEGMEGIESKLIKPQLIINKYFATEKEAIEKLETERDAITQQVDELTEEHGGEDGLFSALDKIIKKAAEQRLKEISGNKEDADERNLLLEYLDLVKKEAELGKQIKDVQKELEKKVWAQYKALKEEQIKTLVVDDKWIATIDAAIKTEMQRISQQLTQRIKELAERYQTPMPVLLDEVDELEEKVNIHLNKMGFVWN